MSIISDATMKKQAVLGDPAHIEKAIKLVASLQNKKPYKKGDNSRDLAKDEGGD